MLHDAYCQEILERNPNMLVPWYLMASYMYYQADSPIITDGLYDEICRRLRTVFRAVQHPHKHLINREELAAGTCLLSERKYPSLTKYAALRLGRRAEKNDIPVAPKTTRVRLEQPTLFAAPTRVRLAKPTRVRLEK